MALSDYAQETCKNILTYLGGKRGLCLMTGAKDFLVDEKETHITLRFDIGSGAKNMIKRVKVAYCLGSDTFKMSFERKPTTTDCISLPFEELQKKVSVSSFSGLHFEDLINVFEDETDFTLNIPAFC